MNEAEGISRIAPLLVAVLALLGACRSGRVALDRGPLGPARYRVALGVSGAPAIRSEDVTAEMRVDNTDAGASLRLAVAGENPVVAELRRLPSGQLTLDTVQGVPPRAAGEADLASIMGQLDPPLPGRRVGLGETWSSTRRISTDTIKATLTSRLRLVGFRRIAGTDAVTLEGTVSGVLRTSGSTGTFDGRVAGRTSIAWALGRGRVVSSETRIVWTIPRLGRLVVRTVVHPE